MQTVKVINGCKGITQVEGIISQRVSVTDGVRSRIKFIKLCGGDSCISLTSRVVLNALPGMLAGPFQDHLNHLNKKLFFRNWLELIYGVGSLLNIAVYLDCGG